MEKSAVMHMLLAEEAHVRRVIRCALPHSRRRDQATADAAFQDTALRALERCASLQASEPTVVRSWLARVATNCAHGCSRRSMRRADREAATSSDPADEDAPSALAGLLRREADTALWQALADLQAEERAVLWLRTCHGLPWELTAHLLLRASPRAARALHERVLGRLRVRVPRSAAV